MTENTITSFTHRDGLVDVFRAVLFHTFVCEHWVVLAHVLGVTETQVFNFKSEMSYMR
jgi:hypothetical protein